MKCSKSNSSGRAIEDDYSDGNSDDDDGEKNETTKKKQQQHQRRRRRHTERRSNATRDFFFLNLFSLYAQTSHWTKRNEKKIELSENQFLLHFFAQCNNHRFN